MAEYAYPMDTTGTSAANRVTSELHTLTANNESTYQTIIPTYSPFFASNVTIEKVANGAGTPLREGVDYTMVLPYLGASRALGIPLYGGISIINRALTGTIAIDYNTLGGEWLADANYVLEMIATKVYNPRAAVWDQITNKATVFPPKPHQQEFDRIYGQKELIDAITSLTAAIANPKNTTSIVKHLLASDNPHKVTKEQVGLGNLGNWKMADELSVKQMEATDVLINPALLGMVVYPLIQRIEKLENEIALLRRQ